MNIEQTLFDTAVDFIKNRYPTGWGVLLLSIQTIIAF